ncbi:MAG TPA: septal ring lytic transglycosylase RlpA family lipoprotein, partial [Tistrella mobilis]|nr:septal ring lytic transglycosylase RlpA family lipoprotein [Tistrella mobilis]
RVNDRGPFVGDRVIDLSKRSAQLLGVIQKGTARVRLENVTEEYGLDYLPEADGVMLASLGAEATATPPATSPRGPVVATASIVEEQVEAVPAGEVFATP